MASFRTSPKVTPRKSMRGWFDARGATHTCAYPWSVGVNMLLTVIN